MQLLGPLKGRGVTFKNISLFGENTYFY